MAEVHAFAEAVGSSEPEGDVLAPFGLTGKIALVTGAASGLGATTAKLFVGAGASVILADINGDGVRAIAEECGAPDKVLPVEMDVASETSVQAGFDLAAKTWGGVDVLVNNAAYRKKCATLSLTTDEWDQMHAVIARGTFLCLKAAVPQMQARGGGSIVNISSVSAVRPTIMPNLHYDSAKAGVDAITRLAAVEFAQDGIRVNSIQPGGMKTQGAANIRSAPGNGAAGNMVGPWMIPGRLPLSRPAEPIEVARAILFLASGASSYVNGVHLLVDGGYSVG